MMDVSCIYNEEGKPGQPSDFKGSERMLGYHITKFHLPKPSTSAKREEPEAKKVKRMEAKPPHFKEVVT